MKWYKLIQVIDVVLQDIGSTAIPNVVESHVWKTLRVEIISYHINLSEYPGSSARLVPDEVMFAV